MGNDKLYYDLYALADVINPDKSKDQLSDNYLRHYLHNFNSIKYDIDKWHEKYLTYLGNDEAILAKYFPTETINAIKEKYPSGCHSLRDYILVHFAEDYPGVYEEVDNDTIRFQDNYLANTGRLFFSRAYVDKLTSEGWLDSDSNKPRLQDPISYFKQRNPDLKQILAFNAKSNQYHFFYSNLELSWVHIQNKDQFILDVFSDVDSLNVLRVMFPQDQLKGAVNALFQTPHELNRLFEKLPQSKYLQVLAWLSDRELDLSANKNSFDHFIFLDVLSQVETLKKSQGLTPYLSEKYQIALMKDALSKYPDLNEKLKGHIQEKINKLAVITIQNGSTDELIFVENMEKWRISLINLIKDPSIKDKNKAAQEINTLHSDFFDWLSQYLSEHKTLYRALQKKIANDSGNEIPEKELYEFFEFMSDSREDLKKEIQNFEIVARQLYATNNPEVDLEYEDSVYKGLVDSMLEQGLNLLNMPNRYKPLINEINLLVKEKVLTDFSRMIFIPPFTAIGPSKQSSPFFYENIDFSYCDLNNAFFMADIFRTNFNYANLKEVSFIQFSNYKSEIWTSRFVGASFSTHSFRELLMLFQENSKELLPNQFKAYTLEETDLREVNFQDESLRRVLQNIPLNYFINLSNVNFQGVDFSDYDLSSMLIKNANMAEVKFNTVSFGPANDLSNVQLTNAVFENVKLANFKQFFDLYDRGIWDYSGFLIKDRKELPNDFMTHSLVDAMLSDDIFYNFYVMGRKDFKRVNLEKIDIKNLEFAKHRGLIFDQNTKFPVGYKPEFKLTAYQQLFDLYDQGIRDFSAYSFTDDRLLRVWLDIQSFPDNLLAKSLENMIFSTNLFDTLCILGRKDFRGTNLEQVSFKSLYKFSKNSLLFDQNTKLPLEPEISPLEKPSPNYLNLRKLESKISRQKAYLTLNKELKKNNLAFELKAVNQGLYFPSFEKRGLTIQGECVSITRGFLQNLFFGNENIFLSNLNVATDLYELIVSNQELSVRESSTLFAFQRSLDSFQKGREKSSSLPQSLIVDMINSDEHDPDLDNDIDILDIRTEAADFSANIIVEDHVVAIYKRDGKYGYFDSNVAWISNIENRYDLKTIMKTAIAAAGYKMSDVGLRIEVFNVHKANHELGVVSKKTLTTELLTERELFALQDSQQGPLHAKGQTIYRKTLYDMRAKIQLSEQDPIPLLIHNELTTTQLVQAIETGQVTISAINYLEKLKGKTAVGIKEIGAEVSGISFSGTKREVEAAKKVKTLLSSAEANHLTNYEWGQLLKAPLKGSLETSSFYLALAKQRMPLQNSGSLSQMGINAAGRISLLRGLHSTIHAGVVGDTTSFFLGAGEISFSFLSDAIEKGVLKITPQLIKQLKSGIYISRGAAGVLGSAFDIVDLVQSSIALSKAEKDSKAYRDAIAGVTFSSVSVVSSVALAAVSSATAATVVGFVIVVGQSFYMAFSTLAEFNKYRLTSDQEARLFFHTLVFLPPPEDVAYKAARDTNIKNLIERSREFLEFSQAVAYLTGLGETLSENPYKHVSAKSKQLGLSFFTGNNLPLSENYHAYCGPSCSKEKLYSLDESIQQASYQYSCELPLIEYTSKKDHSCENTLVLLNTTRLNELKNKRGKAIYDLNLIHTGMVVSMNFRNGTTSHSGKLYVDHEFYIFSGDVKIVTRPYLSNWFKVLSPSFVGEINGAYRSKNILDVSQIQASAITYDQPVEQVSIDILKRRFNPMSIKYPFLGGKIETIERSKFNAKNINYFLGSDKVKETIICNEKESLVVDCKGNSKQDPTSYDEITDCKTVFVYGQTKIWGNKKSYVLYVQPSIGQAEIHVLGGQLIFRDHALLEKASMNYSSSKNALYITIPTASFSMTIFNYLDLKTRLPQFRLFDRHESDIVPLISEQTENSDKQAINFFNLIATVSAKNNAEKIWKDKHKDKLQAESEVEYKNLNLFYKREALRGVRQLIVAKNIELGIQERKYAGSIIDSNPGHWGVITHDPAKNYRISKRINAIEYALQDLTQKLPLLIKQLNQAYGELDSAKMNLEKAKLLEEKARLIKIKDKLDSLDLYQHYAKIGFNPMNYSVFGILKIHQDQGKQQEALFGSKDADVLPLSNEVTYAQGNEGRDIYQINETVSGVLTINNKALDKQLDVIHLTTMPSVGRYNGACDLLVSPSTSQDIIIKDYFVSDEYRHLIFMDEKKQTFLADPSLEEKDYSGGITIPFIPFYLATQHNPVYKIAKQHSSLAMDVTFNTLSAYFQNDALILAGQNAQQGTLILELEDFFSMKTDKTRDLYTYPDNVLINLNQLAKIAIDAEQVKRVFVEDHVHTLMLSFGNKPMVISEIAISSKPHVLIINQIKPDEIVVNRTETDLVFYRGDQTITIKNWNSKNTTQIVSLWFDELSQSLPIGSYRLDEVNELQNALKQLSVLALIEAKIDSFSPEIINILLYFLAVNSVANRVKAHAALGFVTPMAMEDFVQTYATSFSENETIIERVCTHRFLQVAANVLPWILIRGLLKEPDELIQKKIFSCLLDTSFDRHVYLRDRFFKGLILEIPIKLFSMAKYTWDDNLVSLMEKLKMLERTFPMASGYEELVNSFACNNSLLQAQRQASPPPMANKISSLKLPLVKAENIEEKAVKPSATWSSKVWGALAGVAATMSLSTLGYFGIRRYFRGQAAEGPGPALAAAVMIPLMQLSSQPAEAVASSEVKDFPAQLKQDIPVISCFKESFFKPITADKQVPRLEASAANHTRAIPFEADHYGNALLIKLSGYLLGKRSAVKRMNKAERMGTFCERGNHQNLPEVLYEAKKHLDEAIASFGQK